MQDGKNVPYIAGESILGDGGDGGAQVTIHCKSLVTVPPPYERMASDLSTPLVVCLLGALAYRAIVHWIDQKFRAAVEIAKAEAAIDAQEGSGDAAA